MQVGSTTTTSTVMAVMALTFASQACAETQVRPYPDPGYGRLAMYGGGRSFDYAMNKRGMGDTFRDKKQWWADLKKNHDPDRDKHDIYIMFTGLRPRDKTQDLNPQTYIKRLDSWLQPEPGIPTYPELIPIICFGEENRHFLLPVFDAMARHVRETYGIPVMQWWEGWIDPVAADPDLTADAWAFDYYFFEHPDFRPFLMKFVALDRPVICVPWAADVNWSRFHDYQRPWEMINNVEFQFQACMEFNVSTAIFAVAGRNSSGDWKDAVSPDMVATRNWIREKWAEMKSFKPGDLPLPSANYSGRRRTIPVGGPTGEPSVYQDDFDGFRWIDDADLTGFLDMKLTSRPNEPGYLLAKTRADRPVNATITYRFESHFPLKSVEVELIGAAPKSARAANELSIAIGHSSDIRPPNWSMHAQQSGVNKLSPLVLRANRELGDNTKIFYLRVRMQNDARTEDAEANRLDRLIVRCVHDAPDDAVAELETDIYGAFYYEDDFSTSRWREIGSLKVSHAGYGGWQQYNDDLESRAIKGFWPARTKRASFWVGSIDGEHSVVHLVQRFKAGQELSQLKVTVNNWTHREKKGQVVVGVSRRDKPILWQTTNEDHEPYPRKGLRGRNYPDDSKKGWIPLDIEANLTEFDVHIVLKNQRAEATSDERVASVFDLKIKAK